MALSLRGRFGLDVGDKLKIKCSKKEFKLLQRGHGEWASYLSEFIGQQLTLQGFHESGDLVVTCKAQVARISKETVEKIDDCVVTPALGDRFFLGPAALDGEDSATYEYGVVYQESGDITSNSVKVFLKHKDGSFVNKELNKQLLKWKRHEIFREGDDVRVVGTEEAFECLQLDHGGLAPLPKDYVGCVGVVSDITRLFDVKVEFPSSCSAGRGNYQCNPAVLEKVSIAQNFAIGDKVQVTVNLKKFKLIQRKRVKNWSDSLKKRRGVCAIVVGTHEHNSELLDVGEVFVKTADSNQLKLSTLCVNSITESFYPGDKVVSVLSNELLVQLMGDGSLEVCPEKVGEVLATFESCAHVSFPGITANVDIPTKYLLLRGSAERKTSLDSDSDEDENVEEYTFLGTRSGLSVGDVVTTHEEEATFIRSQQLRGGDTDWSLYHLIRSCGAVVKGLTTRNFVIVLTENGKFWRIWASLLKKKEMGEFMLGDLVEVKPEAGHTSKREKLKSLVTFKTGAIGASFSVPHEFGIVMKKYNSSQYKVALIEDNETVVKVVADISRLKRGQLVELTVGDDVICCPDPQVVRKLQNLENLPIPENFEQLVSKTGYVANILPHGHIAVKYEGVDVCVVYNSSLLMRTRDYPKLGVGEKVVMIDDIERVKTNQLNHGEWSPKVNDCFGRVGTVCSVLNSPRKGRDHDLCAEFAGSRGVIPVLINRRSVIPFVEELSRGDNVICALSRQQMRVALPKPNKSEGMQKLDSKRLNVGKVDHVEGEGNDALVTVLYPDGMKMKFYAKHVLRVPQDGAEDDSLIDPIEADPLFRLLLGAAMREGVSGGNLRTSSLSCSSSSDEDEGSVDDSRQRQENGAVGNSSGGDVDAALDDAIPSSSTTIDMGRVPGSSVVLRSNNLGEGDADWERPLSSDRRMSGALAVCVLCYNCDVLVAIRCGHILCQMCADRLLTDEGISTYRMCPLDRKKFKKYTKLYL